MNLTALDTNFYISDQIKIENLDFITKLGVKTIICNRPDGEEIEQPTFSEIKKHFEAAGIACYALPISKLEDVQAASHELKLILNGNYPTLAYCKSGKRSQAAYEYFKRNVK